MKLRKKSTWSRLLGALNRTLWLCVVEIQSRVNLLTHIMEESGIFLLLAVLDPMSEIMSSVLLSFFLTAMLLSKCRFSYSHSAFMEIGRLLATLTLNTDTQKNSGSESFKLASDIKSWFIWLSLNQAMRSLLDHRPFSLNEKARSVPQEPHGLRGGIR